MPRAIPYIKSLPLVGFLPHFRREPFGFFDSIQQKHKDISAFRLGPSNVVFVIHPDLVAHVLHDNNRNYRKSREYDVLKSVLGDGLVTSEGEEWQSIRRIINPVFGRDNLRRLFDLKQSVIKGMIDSWGKHADDGIEVDLWHELHTLTLSVMARTLLGASVDNIKSTIVDTWAVVTKEIARRWFALLPFAHLVRVRDTLQFQKAVRDLRAVVDQIIRERRQSLTRESIDLLYLLLDAVDPTAGTMLSDAQIRDNVTTFIMAGHETTASALTWFWYLVAGHPHVEQRLMSEIDAVLGNREMNAEDIDHMEYTKMVLLETMRLYPPAYIMARTALNDDLIGGFRITKGQTVVIRPISTHRHPDFWSDPDKFDPSRFETGEPRHPCAYLPFGAGPRKCIGAEFAVTEAILIVVNIAQRFILQVRHGHVPYMDPGVTLRVGGGLPVYLRRRSLARNRLS